MDQGFHPLFRPPEAPKGSWLPPLGLPEAKSGGWLPPLCLREAMTGSWLPLHALERAGAGSWLPRACLTTARSGSELPTNVGREANTGGASCDRAVGPGFRGVLLTMLREPLGLCSPRRQTHGPISGCTVDTVPSAACGFAMDPRPRDSRSATGRPVSHTSVTREIGPSRCLRQQYHQILVKRAAGTGR